MIFEIISGGEKTDWVGKDWGEIPACYTGSGSNSRPLDLQSDTHL